MSKYFLLFIIIIFFGCSKTYIDSDDSNTTTTDPFTLSSTYSSVDFAEMNFAYTNPELVRQVEVRRETSEIPLTEYDGQLVFLDSTNQTSFYDYKVTEDQETLAQNTTYYYSIFYRTNDLTVPPKRLKDVTIKTLSYQEGMLQFLMELITYSLSLNSNLKFISSTELLSLFLNTTVDPPTFANENLINAIDGVLVQSLKYKQTNTSQSLTQMSSNNTYIDTLKTNERIFAIDYCTVTNTACINDARSNYLNRDVVGLIHPTTVSDLNNDFPALIDESATSEITSLQDTDLKNFVFIESAYTNMISQLSTSNYDLIIMSPFTSLDWSTLFTSTQIESLKSKSNGTSKRLVYAYVDVSKVLKTNPFYWKTLWNELESRPNWIDKNITTNSDDFYIKYWRNEWKAIVKSVLTSVVNAGYDGIVFGGGEKFANYPMDDS